MKTMVVALLAASAAAGAPREERTAMFREAMLRSLSSLEREWTQPGAQPTSRDLPNAALAKLVLGGSAREAESLVLRTFAAQDMDPASPAFGDISWQIGRPEIRDANSIEFNAQPLGPMLLHYGKQLSPEFRQRIQPHLRAMIAAIRRHKVAVTYTNIYLMKTVNLILLGEVVDDATVAEEGYAQLDTWLAHTRRAGIREYDSPNYYAVDLNVLLMGRHFAARPAAREKFRRALDLFWSDIAANYFAGRGSLSGPHSRNYQFLSGHESVELYLYQEGLRTSPSTVDASIGRIYLLFNEMLRGYRPDARILALAALPERVVRSRWEETPGRDRYNYVTPEFAIGATSASYGFHDRPINIELASARDLPVIYVAPDITDQPYGRLQFKDRSGHNKPVHMPLHPVCVQEKGALLALLDLNAAEQPATSTLATNVVLPAGADAILAGGGKIEIRGEFERSIQSGGVVGVRAGNAGVAIRMFGTDAPLVLKGDAAGLANGAVRLAAYHYRGPEKKLADEHVRVGILFLAGRAATDAELRALVARAAAAGIEEQRKDGAWRVRVVSGALTLEAARGLEKRDILYRRVNGAEMATAVLSVNGRDLAKEILE